MWGSEPLQHHIHRAKQRLTFENADPHVFVVRITAFHTVKGTVFLYWDSLRTDCWVSSDLLSAKKFMGRLYPCPFVLSLREPRNYRVGLLMHERAGARNAYRICGSGDVIRRQQSSKYRRYLLDHFAMFHKTFILFCALASIVSSQDIILTNDDGWAVAQIRAQNDALNAAGFDVSTISSY